MPGIIGILWHSLEHFRFTFYLLMLAYRQCCSLLQCVAVKAHTHINIANLMRHERVFSILSNIFKDQQINVLVIKLFIETSVMIQ